MLNIYINEENGSVIAVLSGEFVPCVGAFRKLEPNTVEASFEKHMPVVTRNGDDLIIKVGSVEHPMTNEHYIQHIFVVYGNSVLRTLLKPGDKPEISVKVDKNVTDIEVYAYCNLHGIWKTEVK